MIIENEYIERERERGRGKQRRVYEHVPCSHIRAAIDDCSRSRSLTKFFRDLTSLLLAKASQVYGFRRCDAMANLHIVILLHPIRATVRASVCTPSVTTYSIRRVARALFAGSFRSPNLAQLRRVSPRLATNTARECPDKSFSPYWTVHFCRFSAPSFFPGYLLPIFTPTGSPCDPAGNDLVDWGWV